MIMFDVVGFGVNDIAETLATTPAAVNSALQRARERIGDGLPRPSQHIDLERLGPGGQRDLVRNYTQALREHDLGALLALLVDDAPWSMPPLSRWCRGHQATTEFLYAGPFINRWQHVPTYANGHLAVGATCGATQPTRSRRSRSMSSPSRKRRVDSVTAFLDAELFPLFGFANTMSADR